MKPAAVQQVKQLEINTTQGPAATLHRESQFVLRYHDEALTNPRRAISLTMPPRPEGYRANTIPPVLAMNLPEGFLLGHISDRFRKVMDLDDMNLLALTSTPSAGRVWAQLPEEIPGREKKAGEPVRLRDLLASRGTEALFDDLVDRYAISTALSGVQPKVSVPEAGGPMEKAMLHTPDLIVKAAGTQWPGLAENEFLCMTMARACGLALPEFWLSEDRRLFVLRRFDLFTDGDYAGFEDMASLTARHPRDKYAGAYSEVARAIREFAAPRYRAESLERFFRQLVFCCLIRNGDAHLKNWGIVYGDPVSADEDARLGPAYDLVCTTVYLPGDVLALGLAGSKAWPDRRALERFAREHCDIDDPGRLVSETVERAMAFRPAEKTPMWKKIRAVLEATASLSLREKGRG